MTIAQMQARQQHRCLLVSGDHDAIPRLPGEAPENRLKSFADATHERQFIGFHGKELRQSLHGPASTRVLLLRIDDVQRTARQQFLHETYVFPGDRLRREGDTTILQPDEVVQRRKLPPNGSDIDVVVVAHVAENR